MMWRHLARDADTGLASAPQVVDRFARREVHQVQRLPGVRGQIDVASDHQALAERRPAAETQLRSGRPCVRMAATRQSLLLAVDRDRASCDRVVLQRAAHQPGGDDGTPVVREADRAGVGERPELRELLTRLPLRDRGEEADGNLRLALRSCAQPANRLGLVDDRLRIRHREDRAVAAGSRRCRSRADCLLVLSTRRAQVHVRVDERRHERLARRLDHAMLVRVESLTDLRDHAAVDANVEDRIHSLERVDESRAAHDDVLASDPPGEHHATPTADSTATGPAVSRS